MAGKNGCMTVRLIMRETVGRLVDLSEGRLVRADECHMGTSEALAVTLGLGYALVEVLSLMSGTSPATVAFWLAYACVASLGFLGMASPYAMRAALRDMAHGWSEALAGGR